LKDFSIIPEWLKTGRLPGQFINDRQRAVLAYAEYVQSGAGLPRKCPIDYMSIGFYRLFQSVSRML
jgi:hypothetical protein